MGDSGFQRRGAHRTACVGDDTVGAEVVAAVLNLQHSPGARFQAAGREKLKVPALKRRVHLLDAPFLLCRQEHPVDKRFSPGTSGDDVDIQSPYLLRLHLGIAAADADDGAGILPPAAANDGAVFFVCHGGYGTGVNDVTVAGFLKTAQGMPHGQDLLLHGLGLVLIDFAA